jgi:hypothetical protein
LYPKFAQPNAWKGLLTAPFRPISGVADELLATTASTTATTASFLTTSSFDAFHLPRLLPRRQSSRIRPPVKPDEDAA